MHVFLALLLALVLVGCGDGTPAEETKKSPSSRDSGELTGNEDSEAGKWRYFGFATRCLQKMTYVGNQSGVDFYPTCSKIFDDPDEEIVRQQLDKWFSENCSQGVYFPIAVGGDSTCWVNNRKNYHVILRTSLKDAKGELDHIGGERGECNETQATLDHMTSFYGTVVCE